MKRGMLIAASLITTVVAVGSAVADPAGSRPADELAQHPPQPPPVEPEAHTGNGFAIAAPQHWLPFANAGHPIVLYLTGDGRPGVPMFDGTLSVLKAVLQVEVFPPGRMSLRERVAKDVRELEVSSALKALREPVVADVTLADGTPAAVLDAEFQRLESGRVQLYCKVYAADASGRHIVASSFVACSRPGVASVKAMGLPAWLRAHTLSLVLDPAKLDTAALLPAYEKHPWQARAAVARASEGNELLGRTEYRAAARVMRQAIKEWHFLPAAHNGLAWALLHHEGSGKKEFVEALSEAKLAVEQTEELDPHALDTLAVAYHLNVEKALAIEAIEKALALSPNDPELQATRRSLE